MAQIKYLFGFFIALTVLLSGCYSPMALSKGDLTAQAEQELKQTQTQTLSALSANDSELTLSVEQAMELAQKSSVTLKVRRANVALSEARIAEAGQIRNPEIRYSQEKLEGGFGDGSRMDVEFRVRPPRPGEVGARKSIAKAAKRAASASLSREKNRVNSRVRTLFREIGFVKAEIEASKASLAQRKNLVELARLRTRRALGTQIDVALAEVTFHEAKQDLTELEGEYDILTKELLRLIGLPQEITLTLKQEPLDKLKIEPLAPLQVYIAQALDNRLELDIAASRIDAARAQTFIEKTQAWPWFSHIKVGYEMRPDDSFDGAVTGGVALEIPLFSLNGGGIEEAETREHLRRSEYELEVEDIIAQVQNQYRQVQIAAEALITLRDGSKVAAEAATAAARAAMKAGQVVVQELALIEERAASTHRQWLKALRRYHREHTQLLQRIAPLQ